MKSYTETLAESQQENLKPTKIFFSKGGGEGELKILSFLVQTCCIRFEETPE